MKFKYYLRGIGTGILLTLVIMLISGQKSRETMSDAEIIEAATKLGMTQKQSSVEISGIKATPTTEVTKEPPKEEIVVTVEPSQDFVTAEPSVSITPIPESDKEEIKSESEPTSEPEPTLEPESDSVEDSNLITLKIKKGMYAEAIANEAYQCGLVDDAEKFRVYLGDNGYASRIFIGTYLFPKGATYKEIADKITTPMN